MKKAMSPTRLFLIIGIVFLLVGVGLLIGAGVVTATRPAESERVYLPAEIVRIDSYRDHDGDRRHDVYVSYEVDGKKYEREIGFYSSDFYEGKVIEVYYVKGHPEKVSVKGGDLFTQILLFGMGAVFAAFGFLTTKASSMGGKKLMENGTLVQAEYVQTKTGPTVNNQYTYYVLCRWHDYESGKEYSFKSGVLWQDPSYVLAQQGIRSIPVYIKPGNPKKYYVDLSGIPGLYLDA